MINITELRKLERIVSGFEEQRQKLVNMTDASPFNMDLKFELETVNTDIEQLNDDILELQNSLIKSVKEKKSKLKNKK